jgi:hypothetical protein
VRKPIRNLAYNLEIVHQDQAEPEAPSSPFSKNVNFLCAKNTCATQSFRRKFEKAVAKICILANILANMQI